MGDKPLDFSPGERWSYTNSGYILLSYIIEQLSGQTFGEYIRENILIPLGMSDSGYDNGRPVIKQMASSYSFYTSYTHPEHEDLSLAFGTYGLYATVEDLYKWDRALYTDKLVSKEGLERMFTPYEDLVVNVLSNFAITPVEQISTEIVSLVLGESIEPIEQIEMRMLNNQELEQYTGTYVVEGEHPETIQITREENRLYITAAKRYGVMYKIPLVAITGDHSMDKFITETVDETIEIQRDEYGGITQMVYRDVYQTTKTALRK